MANCTSTSRARFCGYPPLDDRGAPMKFRVERDALADAVTWAARSLATRPTVPVLAGLLLSVDDTNLTISGFDLEASTRITVDVNVGHQRAGARVRSAAGRDHPRPAAAPGRHRPRRCPADDQLRVGPVHPADHAGRGLPAPARHADHRRHVDGIGVRDGRRAGRGRGRPRRHAADADRRAARDRRREAHAGRDRPLPAGRARARAGSRPPTWTCRCWCPRGRSPTRPRASPATTT